MHKLAAYQLRIATREDGSVDPQALVQLMARTYDEFDRERRLTDRANKLMEEELQDANAQVRQLAEQRLADTMDVMPSPLLLLDPAGRVSSMNAAMTSLCASCTHPPAPDEGFSGFFAALSPDAMPRLSQLLSGDPAELQIGGRWYLAAAHRFKDASYAVILSDVTALKEREVVLGVAKEAAESANRLKSQFLATMSHELRTPLNAILGFSEMIWSKVLGDNPDSWSRYTDYAKAIHSSGDHLRELISEVLDLSKIDAGAHQLTVESCNMSAIIEDSLKLVRPQAARGKVRLLPVRLEGEQGLEADARALKQVLVNLLSNAVKFTPADGEVEVISIRDADGICVTVRDTGIGIAPEHQQKVFEPFHQGDAKVARRYEGTGLGLSIVRGLIEMHGGMVTLESVLHQGTRISFRLPRGAALAKSA
jgi:signal transduction histidine kinase